MTAEEAARDGYWAWNGTVMNYSPDTETVDMNEIVDKESGRTNSTEMDKEIVGTVYVITMEFSDLTDTETSDILQKVKAATYGDRTFWSPFTGGAITRKMFTEDISAKRESITKNGVSMWSFSLKFSEKTGEKISAK